jgi:hypothetical protein
LWRCFTIPSKKPALRFLGSASVLFPALDITQSPTLSNPVPSSTLLPLTASIMRSSVATGTDWNHGRLRLDAAFQAQLPNSESVSKSSILAGEYSNSRVQFFLQSVTETARVNF